LTDLIDKHRKWIPYLFITFTIFIAYLNSFRGIFQFDDYNVIVNNNVVHSWHAWFDDLGHGIRPILKFTYTLNWTSGMGFSGFHLLNLIVHTINALMIYSLSLRLMERVSGRRKAIIISILWAIHPVQSEAVTYISGRSSSLMAMFYLGSILAYVYGIEKQRRIYLYLVSPVFFLMAVLTKETALIFPLALLLWELTQQRRINLITVIKRQIIHWGLLCIMIIAIIIHPNYGGLLEYSLGIRGVGKNLMSQINGVSYLITRVFLIHRLNIDPDLPVISEWSIVLVMECIFLSILLIIGALCLRKRPLLGFGILWFFLHLIPTNSIVPRLDVANERQLYLPVLGLILSFVSIVPVFKETPRPLRGTKDNENPPISPFFKGGLNSPPLEKGGKGGFERGFSDEKGVFKKACIVSLILLLIIFTVRRNHVYRSEVTLWEDTAYKSPQKARVFNNLGYAYTMAGRYKDAEDAYLKAISLKPDYKLPQNNLKELLKKIDHRQNLY